MGFDIFAEITAEDATKIENIRNGQYGDLKISNIYTRLKLLSGSLPYQEKDGKSAHKSIIYDCKNYNTLIDYELERMDCLNIKIPRVNLDNLPPFSFFIQFKFILDKPYLSKDDDDFYICENPIRKDKVFKIPMLGSGGWKGNLRWTTMQVNGANPDIIKRLFGNEKGKEDLKQGRLNFYPTFFNQISLEVINPHDRKTKAGTMPIYIESVPEGASGTFTLLYVPFDLIGKPEKAKAEVKEDLDLTVKAVKEMMLTYGFSAKKTSGFGVIKDEFPKEKEGIFRMNGKEKKFNKLSELKKAIDEVN